MQIAGTPCALCNHRITTVAEGTACAACRSVFHTTCITDRQDICPTCRRRRDPPERHTVYARLCTECLHQNRAPAEACTECGSSLAFENDAALQRRVAEVHAHARWQTLSGAALLGAGLLAIVAFFVAVTIAAMSGAAWFRGSMLVVGLALAAAGLRRWDVGRRLARFP